MTGDPETTEPAPTAPLVPPFAAWIPPSNAHVPTAIVARAVSPTWRTTSFIGRPPTMHQVPSSAVGMDPSTTSTYPSGYAAKVSARDASDADPAAAMSVSW